MLDGCAVDHLQLIARRRNQEAAHSDSQSIQPRTAAETRKHLAESISSIGNELVHMAGHIGDVETKMIKEMKLFIRSYPKPPPRGELSKIPVRNLDQYQRGLFSLP
jgi:anti-sigma28 factor (negative regulator of flagellin synthesis)